MFTTGRNFEWNENCCRTKRSVYLEAKEMPIIFSRGCEYAFQAVLYLGLKAHNGPIHQRDISRALNIPPHFLGKILQLLSHRGLIISQKGKTGGFLLGRSPKDISLYDIVEALDGTEFLDACILGFRECSDENPCPLHFQWKEAQRIIIQMLRSGIVDELSKQIELKVNSVKSGRF